MIHFEGPLIGNSLRTRFRPRGHYFPADIIFHRELVETRQTAGVQHTVFSRTSAKSSSKALRSLLSRHARALRGSGHLATCFPNDHVDYTNFFRKRWNTTVRCLFFISYFNMQLNSKYEFRKVLNYEVHEFLCAIFLFRSYI